MRSGMKPSNCHEWKFKTFPVNLYCVPRLYDYYMWEIESLQNHDHPAMVAHFIPIFLGLYREELITIKIILC
jgi:hypothetical protein